MYSRCCFFHDPLQYATSRDDAPPAEDQRRTDLSWRPQVGLPLLWTVAMAETSYLWEVPTLGGKVRRRLYGMACQWGHFWIPLIQRSLSNNWAPLKSSLIIIFPILYCHIDPYWSKKRSILGIGGIPYPPELKLVPVNFKVDVATC